MVAFITVVVLVGLMLVGVPVCIAMGITSAGVFAALGNAKILAVMAQRIYNGTTGFTMLAIPFFILAGNLMNTGGITDRIFAFANACVGHWTGGLGQVNIVSSVIFSGMSGAAVADAAGLGVIEMKAWMMQVTTTPSVPVSRRPPRPSDRLSRRASHSLYIPPAPVHPLRSSSLPVSCRAS